jgi:hypothetical protein
MAVMNALVAHVKNGRIVLDEPTDLPEGAEVELVVRGGDELDEAERGELHASLERALDDEAAGRVVDAERFLAQVSSEA